MSLRYLTAGESHGKGLLGIIEGIPAGVPLTAEDVHADLRRRKLGYGRGNRQKIESDACELVTGVRHGYTLGSPVGLLIWNADHQKAWSDIMQSEPFDGEVKRRVDVPRPGHADRIGGIKYGHDDMRNVLERSSARETTMRVALGSVARRLLAELGVAIGSRVVRVGAVVDDTPLNLEVGALNAAVDEGPLRALGAQAQTAMVAEVDRAKAAGDTLGGHFEVYASNVPVGVGSYAQWDRRLEAGIGRAFLSLNAIKGVEIGMGFALGTIPRLASARRILSGRHARSDARRRGRHREDRVPHQSLRRHRRRDVDRPDDRRARRDEADRDAHDAPWPRSTCAPAKRSRRTSSAPTLSRSRRPR